MDNTHDETPKMGQTLLSTWNPWAKIEPVYTKAIAFIHSSAIEYFPSFPVSDKLVKTIGMYYYCLHRSLLLLFFGAQRRFWLAWMKQNIHIGTNSVDILSLLPLWDGLIKKKPFYFQIIFDLIFLDSGGVLCPTPLFCTMYSSRSKSIEKLYICSMILYCIIISYCYNMIRYFQAICNSRHPKGTGID